jgi:hypothetical protein
VQGLLLWPCGTPPSVTMSAEAALVQHLRHLEERLAQPQVRRSPEDLSQLLAEDFREFGSSGRVFNKQQIIQALQEQRPCRLSLEDFQAVTLAPDVVLLTYRGCCQFQGSDTVLRSLRSSIWRKQNGSWQVVFHQGTPSAASQPV